MKKIDRFNWVMGKASVELTELLLLPLSDLLALLNAILINAQFFVKMTRESLAHSRNERLQLNGRGSNLLIRLARKIKFALFAFANVNRKLVTDFFFSVLPRQPVVLLFGATGFLSWHWWAFEAQSVWMLVVGLIPAFMVVTCPAGLLYLVSLVV